MTERLIDKPIVIIFLVRVGSYPGSNRRLIHSDTTSIKDAYGSEFREKIYIMKWIDIEYKTD